MRKKDLEFHFLHLSYSGHVKVFLEGVERYTFVDMRTAWETFQFLKEVTKMPVEWRRV